MDMVSMPKRQQPYRDGDYSKGKHTCVIFYIFVPVHFLLICRYLVSFSINFTLFGVSVVFLILAAENIEDMVKNATKDISFCYWIIILAAVLVPFVCLGTPKDFW